MNDDDDDNDDDNGIIIMMSVQITSITKEEGQQTMLICVLKDAVE